MAKAKTEKKNIENKIESKKLVGAVSTRGRTFEGVVTRKFPKRVTIELERTVFISKYERFAKKKTRLHARLPDEMEHEINIGDYIKIRECRPLSKIIHFLVVEKLKSANSEVKQ